MGGLSVANFLAKYNKKVLLIEKHNIPGGLVTSYKRKGVQFDLGIESLYELNEGQTIPQFLEFWGTSINTQKNIGDVSCFVDGKRYNLSHDHLKEDFINAFPNNKEDVKRIFEINEKIFNEMTTGTAPKPPYEMSIFDLIKFGINNYIKKPTFMRYGLKNGNEVFDKLTKNPVLKSIMYSKGIFPMVYMAYVYRWSVIGKDSYPTDGMQSIPNASVQSFVANGGILKLNTEVTKILTKKDKAIGIMTKNGEYYYAKRIISNASPHFTYELLPNNFIKKDKLKHKIEHRDIFPSICALFLSVNKNFDFGSTTNFTFLSSNDYKQNYKSFTPENCPIEMVVYPQKADDINRAVVALMPIPYEYNNCWETGTKRERGKSYYKLKAKVTETVLSRLNLMMGNNFENNIELVELSTPITFERFTYSKNGSFMGWAIDAKNYGKFMNQKTQVQNLYLVGQWVFPGFGVAGVMASGYYLAKELLKLDGIDLEKDYKNYFCNI